MPLATSDEQIGRGGGPRGAAGGVRRGHAAEGPVCPKAAELEVSARTVENWVAACRDGGEAGLE